MKITYDSKYDVLYLKFVKGKRQAINKNLTDDIAVDIDEKGKGEGILLPKSQIVHRRLQGVP